MADVPRRFAGPVTRAIPAVVAGLAVALAGAGPAAASLAVSQRGGVSAPGAQPATLISTPACGAVEFPADSTGSWVIPGGGVDVYSNGPADEGTGSDCVPAPGNLSYVGSVLAGEKWQCPELVNRLYLTRGWIHAAWKGSAGPQLWNNTPGNLSKQANGSVSYLGPGDVVIINVYHNNVLDGGHALIVNDTSHVSGGTVSLVSQNSGYQGTSEPVVSGTISNGSVTVGGGGSGWSYTTIGVVHAPVTSQPAGLSTPNLLSNASFELGSGSGWKNCNLAGR